MRIALVSEHASPLATLGGVDAGGQNVHVAALARGLARRGASVVVHTRRDDASLPARVALCPGVEVHHAVRTSLGFHMQDCHTWELRDRDMHDFSNKSSLSRSGESFG